MCCFLNRRKRNRRRNIWLILAKGALNPPSSKFWPTRILAPIADAGKFIAESAIRSLLESQSPNGKAVPKQLERQVGSKIEIEAPIKFLVKTAVSPEHTGNFNNPTVAPGLVNWHPDFETACVASRKSGKPVLLFHLLGQLNQRFT